jgi:hypothetical protein
MGIAVMVPVAAHALHAHVLTLSGPLWTLIPSQICDGINLDVRSENAPAASTTMQAKAQATQQPSESPFDVQPPEYIVVRGRYQMLDLQPRPQNLTFFQDSARESQN